MLHFAQAIYFPKQHGDAVCLLRVMASSFRDKRVPVTTAWRVLSLRKEEWPSIWWVAANILNKQSRTADKRWSSSLGVGEVPTTPHLKTDLVTKRIQLSWAWTDTSVQIKQWKRDTRFGTWNVRSLYRAGSIATVAGELAWYKLDLMSLQEVR